MTAVRLAALGDSLSAGVGDVVGPGRTPGWPAHLADVVGADERLVLARNGARARDVHREQLAAAVAFAPSVATVMAGGNDVLRGDFDPGDVVEHLGRTTVALQQAGAVVVLATLPTIGLFGFAPPAVQGVMARRIGALNAAVTEVATAHGTLVLDAGRAIAGIGPRAWHIDRIHPSPLGHRVLARAAADVLAVLGVQARGDLTEPPDPPGRADQLGWLVRHGVPWAARRSVDLLPQIAGVLLAELRREAVPGRAREPHVGDDGVPGCGSGPRQGRFRAMPRCAGHAVGAMLEVSAGSDGCTC